jgi:hypothetical protein
MFMRMLHGSMWVYNTRVVWIKKQVTENVYVYVTCEFSENVYVNVTYMRVHNNNKRVGWSKCSCKNVLV